MPEQPNQPSAASSPSNQPGPAPGSQSSPGTPAPTESPTTPAAGPAASHSAQPAPDALPNGQVPTLLNPANKTPPKTVTIDKASLSSVYRKADIITTLITFAGAVVAAGLILAGYAYFTRSLNSPTTPTKTTKLDQAELDKIRSFFTGNSVNTQAEILTVSSSSFFKNRVAFGSDVKVVGGLQTTGPTALSDLTVDKTSTLGVTNVRGQLTVAGPLNLQSPAILAAGATVSGNMTVSGNGSFGGSLSAGLVDIRDLTISGTLSINGHLSIGGQTPSAAPASEAGTGATATVTGNDASGTVTINTGTLTPTVVSTGGHLVTVTFRTPYNRVPRVVITPIGQSGGALSYYVQKTTTNFIIGVSTNAQSNTTYTFDYWIVQ